MRKIQGFRSGSLFYTTKPNTSRANTNLFASAIDHCADVLQIGIPATPPGIIRVADHVSIVRALAAN
jgi:hypothetical protein